MKRIPARGESQRPAPSLPFDASQLTGMRVRPADFARMCEVSRQTVSKWISEGKVTLGVDGRLDPVLASRQVLERSDPTRLRARVFRNASATLEELRARVLSLEAAVSDRDAAIEAMKRVLVHPDDIAQMTMRFCTQIVDDFTALSEAHQAGNAEAFLDALEGRVFWGDDSADEQPECPDASTEQPEE